MDFKKLLRRITGRPVPPDAANSPAENAPADIPTDSYVPLKREDPPIFQPSAEELFHKHMMSPHWKLPALHEAKPADELIARLRECDEFAGNQVVVVDTNKMPLEKHRFFSYVIDRIDYRARGHQDRLKLKAVFQKHADNIHSGFVGNIDIAGTIMPCAYLWELTDSDLSSAHRYKRGALVFAPDDNYTPDKEFFLAGRIKEVPAFESFGDEYRLYALMHEFMHVAGANEPQADLGAGLFIRRMFPECSISQLDADMRWLTAFNLALLIKGNEEKRFHPEFQADAVELSNLRIFQKKYGLASAIACDIVASISSDEASEITWDKIIGSCSISIPNPLEDMQPLLDFVFSEPVYISISFMPEDLRHAGTVFNLAHFMLHDVQMGRQQYPERTLAILERLVEAADNLYHRPSQYKEMHSSGLKPKRYDFTKT